MEGKGSTEVVPFAFQDGEEKVGINELVDVPGRRTTSTYFPMSRVEDNQVFENEMVPIKHLVLIKGDRDDTINSSSISD